jgi:cytochrome c-type biogenesis protein CcmE
MFKKNLNHKQKRLIFVTAIFLISIISLIFILKNFQNNIVFFFSPSEIDKIRSSQASVRVGGMIKKDSIKKIDALTTEFIITDYKNELTINYRGILPDLFREEQGVVAKGKINIAENKFYSTELLVKHDENYMPPEVAKDLLNFKSFSPARP